MSKYLKAHRENDSEPQFEPVSARLSSRSACGDPLKFNYILNDGRFEQVDLTRYRDGCSKLGIMGFPTLIMELLPQFEDYLFRQKRTKGGIKGWMQSRFHLLFSWLTAMQREVGRCPASVYEFTNEDGQHLKDYLLYTKGGVLKYRKKNLSCIYSLLSTARGDHQKLMWPTIEVGDQRKIISDKPPAAFKAIYNACKRILDEGEKKYRLARKWLATGEDPRDIEGIRVMYVKGHRGGFANPAWRNSANLCVLQAKAFSDKVLGTSKIRVVDAKKLQNHLSRGGTLSAGIATRDLMAALGPTQLEVCASALIVSMETGWIDTLENIDLLQDWHIFRRGSNYMKPGKTDSVVIKAVRPKTNKPQIAISAAGSKFRAFQVIKSMEKRSEFLRALAKKRRAMLETAKQTQEVKSEIADIDHILRSPWIYYNLRNRGIKAVGHDRLSHIMSANLPKIRQRAISASERKGYSESLKSAINKISWKDCRDAFAAHLYSASAGNLFLVKRALGHGSIDVTRGYLRQRHLICEHFDAARKVIDTAVEEIDKGRALDPTILFMSANYDDFDASDRVRLRAFRTRMGMGCKDPQNPPPHLSSEANTGAYCSVQRCILCNHGVVFKESWKNLAERHAELVYLRKRTLPNRWLTSTFSWELEALELVRDRFLASVEPRFSEHSELKLSELEAGRAFLFDDHSLVGRVDE
ncbi:hypothetical protein K3740_01725 [Ruegeria conchae]|uniref:hypothetical protein n=1 Tax=Ruegeria conchae TaxID=981384 RepID=UPI0021A42123|nr:hypothetical protein [Ruegeria conchae]UWR03457.1 hypothetical protein K3740_01725 [Ruegeria conchae]